MSIVLKINYYPHCTRRSILKKEYVTFRLAGNFWNRVLGCSVPFGTERFWVQVRSAGPTFEQQVRSYWEWKPSLNSSLAQSTAEMSKGTYRLLTLQIFNTSLFFAGSVIYIAYRPVYGRATRTSDCQIKISRSRGDIIMECVPRDVIRVTGTFHQSYQPSTWTVRRRRPWPPPRNLSAIWPFNAL
jgi:hypothetical protein